MSRARSRLDRLPWPRRQLLLGIGFAASGLVAWWQLQSHPDEERTKGARARLPDYVVLNFSAVETDKTGKPSRRLVADELRHYVDEDMSELEHPRLDLFQPDGPPWHAQARQGEVLAGGDQVRLLGDVHLDREANGQTRSTHLETELLDVWREQAMAETDRLVRIISDGDSVVAHGMRLWYAEPIRVSFRDRARIRLAPEQTEQEITAP